MGRRVVIIGGGIIGLTTAYYCMRRGHAVTLIDRQPGQRDGCSFGNAGMVVPSHFVPLAAPGMVALGLKWMWNPESPFYIKPRLDMDLLKWAWRFWRAANPGHVARSAPLLRDLSLASRECFEELDAEFGREFGLVKRGLLMLCKTQHALDEEAAMAEKARRLGIPAEVHTAKTTAALDPAVTMDIQGSIFFPKDCHLSPARLMDGLQRRLTTGGATFLWETEVLGVRKDGSRIRTLDTSAGEVPAEEVVLCAGSWSPILGQTLGLNLPMQAGKGYSLTLTRPKQLPGICSIFTEARVAVTPMGGTLRFGGTMEIAGLNEDINPVRVRGIIKAIPAYYPEFTPGDFEGIKPWRGLRPCSPDGLPYLGRVQGTPNLVVAAGHAMMGLSLGPITGRLVSELVSGDRPGMDLSLLDPRRFG